MRADPPTRADAQASRPIGVFDSGIGGLSVLNALHRTLPRERFVYLADTGHAPYGERGDAYVIERVRAVARHLRSAHGIKALVVACNTATAAAIQRLRAEHPDLPLVGVEPALKPSVGLSRNRRIAVIATRGTLESDKFAALHASLATQAEFILVPCDGLAAAIEGGDAPRIDALAARYLGAAGPFGTAPGQVDTLVLGCTHYPFIADTLRRHAAAPVTFIDTGEPVARQTERLLAASGQLAGSGDRATVELWSTARPDALDAAAARWLGMPAPPARLALVPTLVTA